MIVKNQLMLLFKRTFTLKEMIKQISEVLRKDEKLMGSLIDCSVKSVD